MSRKRLGVSAVAGAAIAVWMTIGAGPVFAAPAPQTISLLEIDTSDVGIGGADFTSDIGVKVGEGFISTGTYYRWAGTKKGAPYGHLQVVCTIMSITAEGGEAQCAATAFLPGGTIQVAGALSFSRRTNRLPIVGGTGKYVGARGYVATTGIGGESSNTSADRFHIIL